MINKDSLLGLLDVPKENINLFSIRQSQRAKKLIFKVSIRNGLEIILPRRYKDSWVLEVVAKSRPQIKRSLKEIAEARLELKPTSIVLPSIGNSWRVVYREMNAGETRAITETSTGLEVPEKSDDVFWVPIALQEWLQAKAIEYLSPV